MPTSRATRDTSVYFAIFESHSEGIILLLTGISFVHPPGTRISQHQSPPIGWPTQMLHPLNLAIAVMRSWSSAIRSVSQDIKSSRRCTAYAPGDIPPARARLKQFSRPVVRKVRLPPGLVVQPPQTLREDETPSRVHKTESMPCLQLRHRFQLLSHHNFLRTCQVLPHLRLRMTEQPVDLALSVCLFSPNQDVPQLSPESTCRGKR